MTTKPIPPMPAPYTDVPNGLPVGVWKPGMYHSTKYLAWQKKYGTLFNRVKHEPVDLAEDTRRTCRVCGRKFYDPREAVVTCCPGHSDEYKRDANRIPHKQRYQHGKEVA